MKFRPNRIGYGQDFGFHRGLPVDVDFTVTREGDHGFSLIAHGYGLMGVPGGYGNGRLFVSRRSLTSKQRRRFEAAVETGSP